MPYLEENVAPVPFGYTTDPGDTVVVGEAGSRVLVFAEDPEGDPIYFTWALSEYGYVGDATPVPYPDGSAEGSQVQLDWDADLDGQILSCLVDDGENDPVQLRWPVEVYP